MQRNIVTLEQVAKAAGVSMKTVSRVVNNSPQVAPTTRERVQRAIEDLNYQPNHLASSLASGRTNTIGVLVHHTVQEIFAYPFFSELLGGISKGLIENNHDILLRFMEVGTSYTELYDQRRVDGLIVTNPPINKPEMNALLNIPCVFTSRINLKNSNFNMVDSDFFGGMQQLVSYLISNEHRRIGLMAGPESLALSHIRQDAYYATFAEHGLPVDNHLIVNNPLFLGPMESHKQLTEYWLKLDPKPTAIITSDDVTAINMTHQLTEMGYQVPDEMSVVGFDDTMLASLATPQLTSVRQQSYEKGYRAALTLLDVISGKALTPVQIELGMKLSVRQSTGPAPKPIDSLPTVGGQYISNL